MEVALTLVVELPNNQFNIATFKLVSDWNMLVKVATNEVFQIFPDPE